jgi:hypothetical protein
MDGSNPAVATAFDRLNKYRLIGGVTESVPQSSHCAADPLVKIYKHIFRPESLTEILATDNFAWTAQENREGPERQLLDLDLGSALPEFARAQVGLKHAEANS